MPPFHKPGRVYTDSSRELMKVCQDQQWTHDPNTTLHRADTNEITERVVRQVDD